MEGLSHSVIKDVMLSEVVPVVIAFIYFHLAVFLGFGCDTAAVINILAHRDQTQRALIQQEYKAMYSEDLSKRLASELSGKLEVLL